MQAISIQGRDNYCWGGLVVGGGESQRTLCFKEHFIII